MRCPNSETGGHVWIVDAKGNFTCKICGNTDALEHTPTSQLCQEEIWWILTGAAKRGVLDRYDKRTAWGYHQSLKAGRAMDDQKEHQARKLAHKIRNGRYRRSTSVIDHGDTF